MRRTQYKYKRHLSLKDYLFSSSDTNPITRSILCKMNEELTSSDLETAKRFLKDKSHLGFVNYDMTAIQMFQEKFGHKYQSSTGECIRGYMKDIVLREASLLSGSIDMSQYHVEKMYRSNIYDFNLYADYVNAIQS